jgi:hypothetical protein
VPEQLQFRVDRGTLSELNTKNYKIKMPEFSRVVTSTKSLSLMHSMHGNSRLPKQYLLFQIIIPLTTTMNNNAIYCATYATYHVLHIHISKELMPFGKVAETYQPNIFSN